jgi:hypothetical protein
VRKTEFFKDWNIYNVVLSINKASNSLEGASAAYILYLRLEGYAISWCPTLKASSLLVDFPVAKGWSALYAE